MLENFFSFKKKAEPEKTSEQSLCNSKRSEHLTEDVSPIIACVGTSEDFSHDEPGMTGLWGKPDPDKIENVAFFFRSAEPAVPGQVRGDERISYVFSGINDLDKLSRSFRDCTGVIATGKDKETGENISFLSHEAPSYFTGAKEAREKFLNELRAHLEKLKERSVSGTIDAVIAGGNYLDRSSRKDYEESISLTSKEIEKVLGFEPVVIVGPKVVLADMIGEDRLFYNNRDRRLFVMRPWKEDVGQGAYLPHELSGEKEKWVEANKNAK